MIKKIIFFIGVIWEQAKSFILALLIGCAIILATASIIHNVLKIREIYAEDTTGYKSLVQVNDKRMNVYSVGDGASSVVILPEFAECSPIIKYKTYADKLSANYRVATIEYFGYGYSLSSKADRTSMQIASEIKSALTNAGVPGPYIFVANGVSSLYAYAYSNLYPEDMQKIVVIDGVYPKSINDKYTEKYVEDFITNATITSYAELTGYARILSYVTPEAFYIDKMKELGFEKSDIKTYRKMIANRYYTATMRREVKELKSNMENLTNYTYPAYLPVTQVLSNEYVKEVDNLISEGKTSTKLEKYANDMITNSGIQDVVKIDGKKSNLSLDNPDKVVEAIMN